MQLISFHEIIPDGNGGVIVTWMRLPPFREKLISMHKKLMLMEMYYGQLMGLQSVLHAESQVWPQLISDLNGGAIIAWEDGRNGTGTNDIYAQRIDENGIAQWTTDGIPVCTDQSIQNETAICSDGNGGAIIVWTDYRTSGSAIYGQRINSDGEVQWIADGKYIFAAIYSLYKYLF